MGNATEEIQPLLLWYHDQGTIPKSMEESRLGKLKSDQYQAYIWIAASVGIKRPIWCSKKHHLLSILMALPSDTGVEYRMEIVCVDEDKHFTSLIIIIDKEGCLTTIEVDAIYRTEIFPSDFHSDIKHKFSSWTRYVFVDDGIFHPVQIRGKGCRVIALEWLRMTQAALTNDLLQCFDNVSSHVKVFDAFFFSMASVLKQLQITKVPVYQLYYSLLALISLAEPPSCRDKKYIVDDPNIKAMLASVMNSNNLALKAVGVDPVTEAAKRICVKMQEQLKAIPDGSCRVFSHQLDLILLPLIIHLDLFSNLQNVSSLKDASCVMQTIMTTVTSQLDVIINDLKTPLSVQLCLFRYLLEDGRYDKAYSMLSSNKSSSGFLVLCHQNQLKSLLEIAVTNNDWLIALRLIGRSALGYRCLSTSGINKGLIPMFSSTIYDQLADDKTLVFPLFDVAECLGANQLHSTEAQLKLLRLYVQYKHLVDARFKGSVLNMNRLCEVHSLSPDGLSVDIINEKLDLPRYQLKSSSSFLYASANEPPSKSLDSDSLAERLLPRPSPHCCAIS